MERSMIKSEQFREYAEEALQWSRHSETEEEKKALLAKLCGASASQRV
jgi:hypothetical protein